MRQVKQAIGWVFSMLALGIVAACADQPTAPGTAASEAGAARGRLEAFDPTAVAATAVSATITGPNVVKKASTSTWHANASGGTGTYTYLWEFRGVNETTWSPVGFGSSYTRSFGGFVYSFYLRVTVTSGGVSASDEHYVWGAPWEPS